MGIKPVQNQFNGGEISPLMDARFDLAVYQYAAAVMKNNIPASEGYFKRRGGTHFVASAKETDALLFQIVSNVDGAEIWINNIEQDFCYCAPGDTVSYTVSAEGYASKSGVYLVTKNTELTVNLVSNTIKYRFAIEVMPADAVVVINGLERTSAQFGAGSRVEWSVAKDGYRTQSGVIEGISENKTIAVDLKMRLSISATPEDAVVKMNGVVRSYVDVDPNTTVEWSVSKDGYQTQSGTQVVTESLEIDVSLSSQVAGQVMFESSTPGNYNTRLEDGLYELLMCGEGGDGYDSHDIKNKRTNGGSGAAFKGILNLKNDNYNLVVGGDSRFAHIVTTGAGKNSTPDVDGDVGIIFINSTEEIISYEVAANGVQNRVNLSYNYCLLPDPYKSSYGYGGQGKRYYTSGGPAYIRLVYLGKES